VVVVQGARLSQDFTQDRALIRAAVDQKRTVNAPRRPDDIPMRGDFLHVLTDITHYLAHVPQRRKAVIYVGTGDLNGGGWRMRVNDLTLEASRANVNIYCFDLNGLRAPESALNLDPGQFTRDLMLSVSNDTGGRATVNNNRPMDGVPQIFVENGSYYLLGYVSTNPKKDGKLRRIDVKVNRPSVTVRARRGYAAPNEQKFLPDGSPNPGPQTRTQSALATVLPNRELAMVATLAAFAVPGRREASVTVAVGLSVASVTPPGRARTATIELLTRAFTPIGDPRGSRTQTARVTAAAGDGPIPFDALTDMALVPGRYQLRISAHDPVADKDGSVYAFVEVPDFAREPLSLSGVVVSAEPGRLAGPREAVAAVVPVVPTTTRDFAKTDRVTVFLRVYQGGQAPLAAAAVRASIVNDRDLVVFTQTDEYASSRFDAATRAADVRLDLPLATLEPGHHLLTFEAASGSTTVKRHVRFRVR
jgi:hypothetical protein